MLSPCGKIRLRIEETAGVDDQLAGACAGEGIRGIVLAAADIGTIAARAATLGPLGFTIIQE
jgi:4-hydroxyphenylpyruvate dioxygenase-like putative hemolysin